MTIMKKLFILVCVWLTLMLFGFIFGGFTGWAGILGVFIFITLGAYFAIDAFKTKWARTIYVACFVIFLSCLALLVAFSLLRGDPYL